MLESTGAPIPPPTAPQGTNPWIIVVVVIVMLCCFCVGAIGLLFAFGGPILNELGLLHSLVPALII
jgi:hypothetical protein